ncbi:hypothetical protein ACFYNO_32720 [Kitasatospora sp. NPDC006697]|uniref:hypothetical protein n=1 Tax=Kitasatospora sp. NPDC006697 TaxID=3364020 RepID=UPI00369353D4
MDEPQQMEPADGPARPGERRRNWTDWVETASRLAPLIVKVWDLIDRLEDGER